MSEPKTCPAALNIKGEHFPCDEPLDENGRHGWAHNSRAAEAIWQGDEPSLLPRTEVSS